MRSLTFPDEIISIKRQILASEETMKQIWIHLMEGLEENDLLTLAGQYAQEARERDRYVSGLINLYEKEIKKLNDRTADILNNQQKKVLQEELLYLTLYHVMTL